MMARLGLRLRLRNAAMWRHGHAHAPMIRPISSSTAPSSKRNPTVIIITGISTALAFACVGGFAFSTFRRETSLSLLGGSSSSADQLLAPTSHLFPRVEYYNSLDNEQTDVDKLPMEEAQLTAAPSVPPVITRKHPVLLKVPLRTTTRLSQVTNQYKYEEWTFNGTAPGPFIRARVGDVVELSLTNNDTTGNPHNIDSHAFAGPGGGSALTTAEENETKTGRFKLLCPGLYIYHCAAAPVPVHIANGMHGLMYVQPEEQDLPPVDREYYVMQSEIYHEAPDLDDDGRPLDVVDFSYPRGLREDPNAIVFNGRESALTRDAPLKAKVGETVRIFFGNAGPNLTSAFHVIGTHFLNCYRDGDVTSPPARFVGTTSVPPGGTTIVDMKMVVPGSYTIVDHAIFRLDKGAVGFINVSGPQRPDVYVGNLPPQPCVGCKLHA
ncbi:hypothetical protein ED733_004826 [Metarhizium rileyi]|uniref:Copper-containing nitrite reductase n=1 Tax=Metarhizium rileyi (strain RCEF 4871) TaxID=1649241 RepID=A0A5C6GBJ3_METRR|nr:hypothetical protein ED733_004826 [Metarhizium rileyi]